MRFQAGDPGRMSVFETNDQVDVDLFIGGNVLECDKLHIPSPPPALFQRRIEDGLNRDKAIDRDDALKPFPSMRDTQNQPKSRSRHVSILPNPDRPLLAIIVPKHGVNTFNYLAFHCTGKGSDLSGKSGLRK